MNGMNQGERLRLWMEKIQSETRSAGKTATDALNLLSGDVVENGSDDVVDPLPTPDLSSVVVGKASGAPGETVHVEVLGGTHIPVNGFGLAIGCDKNVKLVDSGVSKMLTETLGVNRPQVIVKQQRGLMEKQNFIQVAVFFVSEFLSEEQVEGNEPPPVGIKRTIVDKQLPPMTKIYFLALKIPESAEPGDRIPLTPGFDYGRPLSNAGGRMTWLPYPTMYTTSREYGQHGITKVNLVEGWIDVT